MRYTKDEIKFLQENYHYLDRQTLLSVLNRPWYSIKHKAKKLGLSRPNIRDSKLKKILDSSIHNAYWWGFIMADGHISKKGDLIIVLSEKDKEHLNLFLNHLNLKSNIKQNKKKLVRLSIMDKINGNKLKDLLQINNGKKTYNPPINHSFLKNPNEILAFLIGFIDGDGNIQKRKTRNGFSFQSIRITIHKNWFRWFKNFTDEIKFIFNNLEFTVNNSNKRENTHIYLGKQSNFIFLKNFIEQHKLPALKRKWVL